MNVYCQVDSLQFLSLTPWPVASVCMLLPCQLMDPCGNGMPAQAVGGHIPGSVSHVLLMNL